LLSNLLSVPGIGTFLAGRRVTGVLQMTLSSLGFVLSFYWFAAFLVEWWRQSVFPWEGGSQFRWGLIGVGLYAVAWVWGLASGLQIRRASRTTKP